MQVIERSNNVMEQNVLCYAIIECLNLISKVSIFTVDFSLFCERAGYAWSSRWSYKEVESKTGMVSTDYTA